MEDKDALLDLLDKLKDHIEIENMGYEHECMSQERHIINFFTTLLHDHPRRLRSLEQECQTLAQDQFSKAHLGEVQKLSDRIESVLIQWDETIKKLTDRIEKLEK
jgi:hypothetical protein